MSEPSTLRERYTATESGLLLTLTASITGLHGLAMAMQFLLQEKNTQSLGLSGVEWVAYTVGPFLVEPILLFGGLYYVTKRSTQLPSLPTLVPGLVVAVLLGTFVGQYAGEELFMTGWTPLAQASIDVLFTLDWATLPYWRDLLAPLIRSSLTAVAAVALAKASAGETASPLGTRGRN